MDINKKDLELIIVGLRRLESSTKSENLYRLELVEFLEQELEQEQEKEQENENAVEYGEGRLSVRERNS